MLVKYEYLNRFPYGKVGKNGKKNFKYFIGYKNNEKVYLLCIRHPQMTGYLNGFKENKYMNFLIKDNQLLKKCNKIWDNLMATRCYDDKSLNTKVLMWSN